MSLYELERREGVVEEMEQTRSWRIMRIFAGSLEVGKAKQACEITSIKVGKWQGINQLKEKMFPGE